MDIHLQSVGFPHDNWKIGKSPFFNRKYIFIQIVRFPASHLSFRRGKTLKKKSTTPKNFFLLVFVSKEKLQVESISASYKVGTIPVINGVIYTLHETNIAPKNDGFQ